MRLLILAIFAIQFSSPLLEAQEPEPRELRRSDWALSGLRFAMVGGAVGAGAALEFEADPLSAAIVGATAGGMSAGLMLIHPQLVRWLSSKGYLKIDPSTESSFLEMHIKELLISFGFNYSVQVVSGLNGLSENTFSPVAPLVIALIALPTQGIWELSISRITQRLLNKYEEYQDRIWLGSKLAIISNSALSTFASVSTMLGADWTGYLLGGIGVTGFATYGLTCTRPGACILEKINRSCKGVLAKLKNQKSSLNPSEP